MFDLGLSAAATSIVTGFALVHGATMVPSIALGAGVGLGTLAASYAIDTFCPNLESSAYIKAILGYVGCVIATQAPLNPIIPGAVALCSGLLSNAVLESESCGSQIHETLKAATKLICTASGAFVSGVFTSLALGIYSGSLKCELTAD